MVSGPPNLTSRSKSGPASSFHFLAGLFSGLSTSILLQPADLLKTRVQQSPSTHFLPALRSILASSHPIRSLWRGTLPSALRTGFGSALYFSSLNALRQRITQTQQAAGNGVAAPIFRGSSVLPRLSNAENLLTGAVARVFAGFVMMPVTVIKVRYESDFYGYRSLVGAGRDILATEGIRGFFSGLGATAVRDAPYAGLYVLFYEGGKGWFNSLARSKGGSEGADGGSAGPRPAAAGVHFMSGVCAAGLATSLTNPFDAVKTRLQLMPARYGNMVRAARMMVREEGLRCFADGLGLRMGRKAISSALAWTVYEELIGRAERRISSEQSVGVL